MPGLLASVYLSAFLGAHIGGDTDSCLGRGALGSTAGIRAGPVFVEGEVATAEGRAPLQVATALANVTVGPTGAVRPYVLVGAGVMGLFRPLTAEAGFAWGFGGGVEMMRHELGVRFDARYIEGPLRFGRVTAGLVLRL